MSRVHLDYNATTPLRPEARAVFLEVLDSAAGNPSSVHHSGRAARAVVDDARARVADALGVDEDAIVFTSGGTEANNLALFGSLEALEGPIQLITTPVEHAAVLEPARAAAERWGGRVRLRLLTVDAAGRPDLDELQALIAEGPALVSIIAANNEIGTVTSYGEIRAILGERSDLIYHSDSVQLLGKRRFDLSAVDLATFSAHKVGGPVGVGILVRRRKTPLAPRLFGGSQEAALRPGTENVAAIAAAACAVDLAVQETAAFETMTAARTGQLWTGLREAIPGIQLNGPALDDPRRLTNTLNVSAPLQDARTLVVKLDLAGLEVSAGSACASGSIEPSHVLGALGIDPQRAAAGIRISLGKSTTEEDIHTAVDKLRRTLGEAS
ncbi:Cysteine desulfurase [Planctomycetes bacterium Poly30]|uniref:cysteine desulfurase n=1 Tax=Saltatorellus ferox TaxID=2528018 RepID=A0A518F1F8_9BACT|nr:Cysteine desulfurase [Planctomycetes bacterium Poly30]